MGSKRHHGQAISKLVMHITIFDYSPKWTLFAEDACEKLP